MEEDNKDISAFTEQPIEKRKRGRPRKYPIGEDNKDISASTGQPVEKRKRGRPRKYPVVEKPVPDVEEYFKTHKGPGRPPREIADLLKKLRAEEKLKEELKQVKWRLINGLSPIYNIYVSTQGEVKVAAKATRNKGGFPEVFIDGCPIMLDQLVMACFGKMPNPAEYGLPLGISEDYWMYFGIYHKNGDPMDCRLENLEWRRLPGDVKAQRPTVTPFDVIRGRFPYVLERSDFMKAYLSQKLKNRVPGQTSDSQRMVFSEELVSLITSICRDVYMESMSQFLVDTFRGNAMFASPILRNRFADIPPSEYQRIAGSATVADEIIKASEPYGDWNRFVDGNSRVDLAGYRDQLQTGRLSRDSEFLESLQDQHDYDMEHALDYRAAYRDFNGELEILKGSKEKPFPKNPDECVVIKGRYKKDTGYVIVMRRFNRMSDGTEIGTIFYRIPKDIWDKAKRILAKIARKDGNTDVCKRIRMNVRPQKDKFGVIQSYLYMERRSTLEIEGNNPDELKTAADWFENPYNRKKGSDEMMDRGISASETEMLFVICEELYASKMEMVKNSKEILESRENNMDIRRFRNRNIRDERERLAKTGRLRVELLTDQEREDLKNNIRKIPFATLMGYTCMRQTKDEYGRTRGIQVLAEFPSGAQQYYPSISEAARQLNLSNSLIQRCINGKAQSVHGVKFIAVDFDDSLSALNRLVQLANAEWVDEVEKEKERIRKEKDANSTKNFGGNSFKTQRQNIKPWGKEIGEDGSLIDDGIDHMKKHEPVKLVEPVGDIPIKEGDVRLGDIMDKEKEKAERQERLKNKVREVGSDGKEKPDDDDLDALLDT